LAQYKKGQDREGRKGDGKDERKERGTIDATYKIDSVKVFFRQNGDAITGRLLQHVFADLRKGQSGRGSTKYTVSRDMSVHDRDGVYC
jgi:hypothetical protein